MISNNKNKEKNKKNWIKLILIYKIKKLKLPQDQKFKSKEAGDNL